MIKAGTQLVKGGTKIEGEDLPWDISEIDW